MSKDEGPFEIIEIDVLNGGDQVSAEELRLLEKHLPDVLKAVVALMNVEEE